MTEAEREQEQAMVLLGTHGSTTYPPEQWHGWRWAEQGYAPEFLGFDDRGGHDASDCVTVLHNGFGELPDVPGYGKVYEFVPGECSCPWCGDGTGEEGKRAECQLCEGNGLIYWGEEWSVVVLAPNTEV